MAPTVDNDPGAAGRLSAGALGQAAIGAFILWQGILDMKFGHTGLTGAACILDGLPCKDTGRVRLRFTVDWRSVWPPQVAGQSM